MEFHQLERALEMPRVISRNDGGPSEELRGKLGRKALVRFTQNDDGSITIDNSHWAMCYGPLLAYRYEASEYTSKCLMLPIVASRNNGTTDNGVNVTYYPALSKEWCEIYDRTVGKFILEHLPFFATFNDISRSKYGFDVYELVKVDGLETPLIALNVISGDELEGMGIFKPIWKLGAFALRLIAEYDNNAAYSEKDINNILYRMQGIPDLEYSSWLNNLLYTGGVHSIYNSPFAFTSTMDTSDEVGSEDISWFFASNPDKYAELLDKRLFTKEGAALLHIILGRIPDDEYGDGYNVMSVVVGNAIKVVHNDYWMKKGY